MPDGMRPRQECQVPLTYNGPAFCSFECKLYYGGMHNVDWDYIPYGAMPITHEAINEDFKWLPGRGVTLGGWHRFEYREFAGKKERVLAW